MLSSQFIAIRNFLLQVLEAEERDCFVIKDINVTNELIALNVTDMHGCDYPIVIHHSYNPSFFKNFIYEQFDIKITGRYFNV